MNDLLKDKPNRIEKILSEKVAFSRYHNPFMILSGKMRQSYNDLFLGLPTKIGSEGDPLSNSEIDFLIKNQQLVNEYSYKGMTWRLLLSGVKGKNEPAKEFAQSCLENSPDPKNPERQSALSYLTSWYPEMWDSLKSKYSSDADPNVRYVLAERLELIDPHLAKKIMLELLPLVDIDNRDSIRFYLDEFNKKGI